MSIVVYNEVAEPIIPAGDLAGPVRDALGDSLRSMRYPTPDFAGLYQDAAGTTPVTAVGQPVGLMLDRRFGLVRGPELVPNGTFASGISGWSPGGVAQLAHVDGRLRVTNPSSAGSAFAGTVVSGFIAGRSHEITADVWTVSSTTTGRNRLTVGGVTDFDVPRSQRKIRGVFDPEIATRAIRAQALRAGTETVVVDWDNISIRELPGNHASQATTTARPTLRSGPLRIDYDGVDDYLRTVFPDLGGDVTIARSIPGVGAQILTGQTIAAGDWDDNVTSCATLVIDRALTGPETALVTAFLNQQAGV